MVTPLTVDIDADIRGALTYDALNEQIMSIRRALYHDLGVPFPGINLSLNPAMKDGRYRLLVNEVPVSEGMLRKGYVFALEDAENLTATGIPFETGKPFLSGHETCWVKEEEKSRLDESGVRSLDLGGVLTYHLSGVLRRYAHEFLSLQETRLLFDHMEKEAPELVREVQRVLPLQKITDVLQRLVQEGICVRDLKRITQTLIEWGQKEKDAVLLVEYVRSALSRYISYKFSEHRCGVSARPDAGGEDPQVRAPDVRRQLPGDGSRHRALHPRRRQAHDRRPREDTAEARDHRLGGHPPLLPQDDREGLLRAAGAVLPGTERRDQHPAAREAETVSDE